MNKTVVALYSDVGAAERAVHGLIDGGFAREDISLIAHDTARKTSAAETDMGSSAHANAGQVVGIGAAFGGLAGLVAGLVALAIPGVGPIIAAGPLAVAVTGLGVGAATGGILGVLAELGLPEDEARRYAEGVRRGETLVAVRTGDDRRADQARTILSQYHPANIEAEEGVYGETRPASAERQTAGAPGAAGQSEAVDEEQTPARSMPMGGADTGAMVASPNPERAEERLDLGLPDSLGTRVDDRWDAELSGAEDVAADTASEELTAGAERAAGPVAGASAVSGASGKHGEFDLASTGHDWEPEGSMSADQMTGSGPGRSDVADFRSHYSIVYSGRGHDFAYYEAAYAYGAGLSGVEGLRGRSWSDLEPDARAGWERDHIGSAWADFRDAVRYGWQRAAAGAVPSDQPGMLPPGAFERPSYDPGERPAYDAGEKRTPGMQEQ